MPERMSEHITFQSIPRPFMLDDASERHIPDLMPVKMSEHCASAHVSVCQHSLSIHVLCLHPHLRVGITQIQYVFLCIRLVGHV